MASCRSVFLMTVSLGLWMGVGPPAWATVDNQKSYKAAYPDKEAKAYSCKVCHLGAIGKKGDLNAYGTALKEFKAAMPADAKKLTEGDYRGFETADNDADGATNAQELEAGTDLSDPASVPALQETETIKKNDVEVQAEPYTEEGGQ